MRIHGIEFVHCGALVFKQSTGIHEMDIVKCAALVFKWNLRVYSDYNDLNSTKHTRSSKGSSLIQAFTVVI